MPSISIIIPYYNVRTELFQQCIKSVMEQSFTDFEVLVIDDGSDEKYTDRLKEITAQDARIHLYRQENQGVSAARNYGVQLASGKYIAFADADDRLTPWFLEEAYKLAEENTADIVYGLMSFTSSYTKMPGRCSQPEIRIRDEEWLERYTIGYLYHDGKRVFGRGPWARLIRSSIAKSVAFPIGVPIGEDVLWNLEIIQNTKKRIVSSQTWYVYLKNTESVTGRYNPAIEEKLLPFYERLDACYDTDSFLYWRRVQRDLKRYIFDLYCGNRADPDPFFVRWRKFNQICKRYPWRRSRELPDIGKTSPKVMMTCAAFATLNKTNLLFPCFIIYNQYVNTKKCMRSRNKNKEQAIA